jgi:hypothetical protein
MFDGQHACFMPPTGTFLVPRDFPTEDIPVWLNANATPSPAGPQALKDAMDKVMSLYPDDPSAGSPFGTGNQTFGTGSGYKRESAICTSSIFSVSFRDFFLC